VTTVSDLLSSGRVIGGLVRAESSLFEATGAWVRGTPEPEVRVFIATTSGHHGGHAELLSTLLPIVAGGPTIDELVAPAPGMADLVHATEALDENTSSAVRIGVVWQRAVRAVIAAAEQHIASSTAIAEATTHRLLRIVIAEELADIATSEQVLARLSGTTAAG
jgi:hypothetical protein